MRESPAAAHLPPLWTGNPRVGEPIISIERASTRSLIPPPSKRAGTAVVQADAVLTPRVRSRISILVVDEEGIMRDGLCALLASTEDFKVVGTHSGADAALHAVASAQPDVMIIDLSHPNIVGPATIAEAKVRHPPVRVLVLTFRKDDNVIDAALRAGADGYVLKNDSCSDLFMALHSIASGRGYISPSICDRVMGGYVRARDPMRRRSTERGELTERERQVMRLIAAGHRTREMAQLLTLSHKTVEKHRSNLMRKLGLRNASAVAAYAIANGYFDL